MSRSIEFTLALERVVHGKPCLDSPDECVTPVKRDTLWMIINAQNLDLVYKGFQSVYTDAFLQAEVNWDKIAMAVASEDGEGSEGSEGSEETYGWLGQFPQRREWVGKRHVKNLTAHGFTIKNREFESTVGIPRDPGACRVHLEPRIQ